MKTKSGIIREIPDRIVKIEKNPMDCIMRWCFHRANLTIIEGFLTRGFSKSKKITIFALPKIKNAWLAWKNISSIYSGARNYNGFGNKPKDIITLIIN